MGKQAQQAASGGRERGAALPARAHERVRGVYKCTERVRGVGVYRCTDAYDCVDVYNLVLRSI